MTNYFEKFRNKLRRCSCSLKTWGIVAGWLGVTWRTVATIFLATIIARLTEFDPNLYHVILITALSYVQISLVANLFFLVGIQKERPYLMLPYIVTGGLELFFGLFVLIGGILVLHSFNWDYALTYFIPVTVLLIGIYFFFWIQSIKLFKNMEIEIARKKEDNAKLASIRQSYVNR